MNHRRFLTFVLLIFLTLCCFSCVHNGYRQETTGTFAETEAWGKPIALPFADGMYMEIEPPFKIPKEESELSKEQDAKAIAMQTKRNEIFL